MIFFLVVGGGGGGGPVGVTGLKVTGTQGPVHLNRAWEAG